MLDGCEKRTLNLQELLAPIDVERLNAALKLLQAEMLRDPTMSAEALALKEFINLLEEV